METSSEIKQDQVLAEENGKLQKELEKLRAELAEAQQKLHVASSEKPLYAVPHQSPLVVNRARMELSQSQKPDSAALVRLAQRKDNSISSRQIRH